jgi:hypothetical protein
MKNFLLIAFTLLLIIPFAQAQSEEKKTADKNLETSYSIVYHPYFVITSQDNKSETRVFEARQFENGTSQIDWLRPESIESMNVLKGKDATDKYGVQGSNGVIQIQLKEGFFEKLPEEIKTKFKVSSTSN